LPVGTDHAGGGPPGEESQPDRRGDRGRHDRQHLPLRHICAHQARDQARRAGGVAMTTRFSRREFLRSTAAAGVGLTLRFTIPGGVDEAGAATSFEPNAALTITPDGAVTVHITKAEMGQGVGTALAQIVAEELEADWKDIRIDYPINDPKYGLMLTGGSWSVNWTFDALSRAGAAARIMLVDAAARYWKVSPDDCTAERGVVRHLPTGRSIAYGDIVAKVPITKTLSEDDLKKIRLKEPSEYRVVGKWIPRLDIPEKTNGRARFGIDTFLPGMVYAKVAYPPTREAGKHTAVDDSAAKKVKGYVATVVTPGLVAVVATTYENAVKARDALRITWDQGPNANVSSESIFAAFAKKAAEDTSALAWLEQGDVKAAMAQAPKRPEATLQMMRAGLDGDGKVIAWENTVVASHPGQRWGPDFVDKRGLDQFALNGADHVYDIPNQLVRAIPVATGIPVGYVRAVAPNYTFFAVETFVDELARLAGVDPVEYRLTML